MKKTIFSIAVIATALVAASCQKENLQENTASEGNTSVFTAAIETGASTKTTVERVDGTPATYKTKWEDNEQININGSIYKATPNSTDKTKATFTKVSGEDPTGTFKAYFPANMYSDSKTTLPASYTYADGDAYPEKQYNMPMYAQSETESLSFKNLCGVLAITVSGADFTSVEKIELFSDKQMNGEFTAAADGTLTFKAEGVTLTDANRKVTLEFTSAKTIASDGSATFYIPVPANTHNPLTIKVTGGSTPKVMVTKKSGGVAVVRNTVYPIAFDGQPTTGTAKRDGDIDVNWVQLWVGGPKFAECNVGTRINSPEYYVYYTWGGRYQNGNGIPWNDDHDINNPGTGNLTGSDDTATYLWGSNWRMPTREEFQKLLDNCTVENIINPNDNTKLLGRKYTGKGAYASNSVFLPAADCCERGSVYVHGKYGYYWSSTPNGGNYAYNLTFNSEGYQRVDFHLRGYGYSVRAVLAE